MEFNYHLKPVPAAMLPQWRTASSNEMNNNAGCQDNCTRLQTVIFAPSKWGPSIYSTFVSTLPPPALSIYDEICGITLSWTLDSLFDS